MENEGEEGEDGMAAVEGSVAAGDVVGGGDGGCVSVAFAVVSDVAVGLKARVARASLSASSALFLGGSDAGAGAGVDVGVSATGAGVDDDPTAVGGSGAAGAAAAVGKEAEAGITDSVVSGCGFSRPAGAFTAAATSRADRGGILVFVVEWVVSGMAARSNARSSSSSSLSDNTSAFRASAPFLSAAAAALLLALTAPVARVAPAPAPARIRPAPPLALASLSSRTERSCS